MRKRAFLIALALLPGISVGAAAGDEASLPACGMSPSDWCPSPPGDPCGVHTDTASCKGDPKCYGMPYRGESVIACMFDDRGFASNCPSVGCTATPPAKPGG